MESYENNGEENYEDYDQWEHGTPGEPQTKVRRLEEDLGGLGGRPITAHAVESSANVAKLRNQIKYLKRTHPELELFSQTELDAQLTNLGEEELKEIIYNLKSQLGGSSAFTVPTTMVKTLGYLIEEKSGIAGYQKTLSNDVDLILTLDEMMPEFVSKFGIPVKLAWSLWSAFVNCVKDDGKPPIAAREKAVAQTPDAPASNRKIPDGQDNLHREDDNANVQSTD